MENFPTLETERLLLNELQAGDIPRIVQYASNPQISQFTLNIPHPYSEKDAISWMAQCHQRFQEGTQVVFAIRLKPELEFIGGIGLMLAKKYHHAEMGYWIAQPFWNQGYVSEALASIMAYGFQKLQLNKLFATHLDQNTASGKVMIKNGMVREGVLKEHIYKNGAYFDLIQYGLTRKQYQS